MSFPQIFVERTDELEKNTHKKTSFGEEVLCQLAELSLSPYCATFIWLNIFTQGLNLLCA